jgi:hypothetical protein
MVEFGIYGISLNRTYGSENAGENVGVGSKIITLDR